MTKKEEVQEWFLMKWNWDSWLLTLSDEDAGKVLKALYTGIMPDGLLGTLINSHFDEFKRVNDFRAEKQREHSKTNSENAKSRWEKYRELESERKEKSNIVYDRTFDNTTVSNRTTSVSNRNANTEDILHSTQHIEHSIDDVVNSIDDSTYSIKLSEYYSNLSDKERNELIRVTKPMSKSESREYMTNIILNQ